MKKFWKVQIKGSMVYEDFELCVIHKDNKHGQISYGWGDLDKILLFENISRNGKEERRFMKNVANTLCHTLNNSDYNKPAKELWGVSYE